MQKRFISLQVACVYIGTVVGAGFASGREIYEFFVRFGPIAYLSICCVTVLFAWLGYRLMYLGAVLKAVSFRDVNARLFGPRLRKFIDGVMLFMLFGITVAMLAGTGELFKEQLNLPFTIGVVVGIVSTWVTMVYGMNGIMKVNSIIVPTLITFVFYTAIHTFSQTTQFSLSFVNHHAALHLLGLPVWMSGLLYAAMNIGLSVGVLVPLGGQVANLKALRNGAIIGAIGLGLMLCAVSYSLLHYLPAITQYAIPMAWIASNFKPWLTALFIAVLFGEIYSTLIGNVYALVATVAIDKKGMLIVSGALLLAAGALSHFGFRLIITYGYTTFGWISLFFILTVAFTKLKEG